MTRTRQFSVQPASPGDICKKLRGLSPKLRRCALAGMLALTPLMGHAETITFRTVDFKMPADIRAKIPRSVKKEDIFVSSENCYYVRTQLSFAFIGCVG